MGTQGSPARLHHAVDPGCDWLRTGRGLPDLPAVSLRTGDGLWLLRAGPRPGGRPVRGTGSSPGTPLLHDPEWFVCRAVTPDRLLAANHIRLARQLLRIRADGAGHVDPCVL